MISLLKVPIEWLEGFGVNGAFIMLFTGVLLLFYIVTQIPIGGNKVIEFIIALAPIWLPVITFLLFFEFWSNYVKKEYDLAQGRQTIEIKLPQEIFKSPEAMELVLVQLHQIASPDNHVQTYWDGKHPPVYALEIVSRGGDVRFYINLPYKKFKNLAMTQLYAQYPGIEITELEIDYTAEIISNSNKFSYFSLHMGTKKEEALPIKTYFEYGLQAMPKEEEKIDPITPMLEMLASIGPGEQYWVQILIDANRKTNFETGSLTKQPDWTDDAKKHIQKIIDTAKERADGEVGGNTLQLLTEAEKDTIKSIERSIGKNAFNTGIRIMYLATNDAFNPGERIGALVTGWRAYDDLNRNAIGVRWRTDFNWNWWQDPSGKRRDALKKEELMSYKKRIYFSYAKSDRKKVLTVEELATIFHLPGQVATTPTLGRIPSTRGEAPSNLPIS